MIDRQQPSGLLTPGRLLKQATVVYAFIHVTLFFLTATADGQQDAYYFCFFALGLIWASASLFVSTFLGTRRAWLGQPPADIRDGIVPAIVVFALGFAIWTLAHL